MSGWGCNGGACQKANRRRYCPGFLEGLGWYAYMHMHMCYWVPT